MIAFGVFGTLCMRNHVVQSHLGLAFLAWHVCDVYLYCHDVKQLFLLLTYSIM